MQMQHAKSCAGYCGEWTDQRGVIWQFCRMTDRHLQNTIKHLESNAGRATVADLRKLDDALKEREWRRDKGVTQ
jgi:hypothetical protein